MSTGPRPRKLPGARDRARKIAARLPSAGRLGLFGERYALLGAWLLVIVVFGILLPDTFLTAANFQNVFGAQAILIILTLGLLLPLTAGEFDLSVASVMSLSAMVTVLLNARAGWPIGAAILAAIVMGGGIGWCNGALIVRFGVDSFIVTLGTSTVLTGLLQWVSDYRSVSGVSSILIDLVVTDRLFGISLMFYYGLALTVMIWLLLEHSPLGRRLLFVGRGRNVAVLSGMRVNRLRWGTLVASGGIAAGAGVCLAGLAGGADPSSGLSFLLPAFAAAYLGASTIRPGRFNAWGSFAAVYFLVTGITGFQLLGVSSYVQDLFYGAALIIAVLLSKLVAQRREATANQG